MWPKQWALIQTNNEATFVYNLNIAIEGIGTAKLFNINVYVYNWNKHF